MCMLGKGQKVEVKQLMWLLGWAPVMNIFRLVHREMPISLFSIVFFPLLSGKNPLGLTLDIFPHWKANWILTWKVWPTFYLHKRIFFQSGGESGDEVLWLTFIILWLNLLFLGSFPQYVEGFLFPHLYPIEVKWKWKAKLAWKAGWSKRQFAYVLKDGEWICGRWSQNKHTSLPLCVCWLGVCVAVCVQGQWPM